MCKGTSPVQTRQEPTEHEIEEDIIEDGGMIEMGGQGRCRQAELPKLGEPPSDNSSSGKASNEDNNADEQDLEYVDVEREEEESDSDKITGVEEGIDTVE